MTAQPFLPGIDRTPSGRKRPPTVPSESTEGRLLMQWANKQGITRLFHIGNGGLRDKKTAAILKLQGVKRGIPDYCLPIPNAHHAGLWIELKTEYGEVSPEQSDWLQHLNQSGYKAVVAIGHYQAIAEIESYLAPRIH